MSIGIKNGQTQLLLNELSRQQKQQSESLGRLSSGQVFAPQSAFSADRAIAENFERKLRGLNSAKQNINDGVSLIQTAESGLAEISNIILRMKELNAGAATSIASDDERRFLFLEYDALHKELDRIASTTEFNGLNLINGSVEEDLVLRLGDPTGEKVDVNSVSLSQLKDLASTTAKLGLRSVAKLLSNDDPIELDDALDIFASSDGKSASIYDQALQKVGEFRARLGAIQSRLDMARDYNEVAYENIAAAKSRIADTDYASEVSKLTQSNILMQTSTALLAQNNLAGRIALNLVNSLLS